MQKKNEKRSLCVINEHFRLFFKAKYGKKDVDAECGINAMLSIGLMSGTSMDGIDAALIQTDGYHEIVELGHCSIAYHPAFKILLKAAEYAIKTTAEIQIAQGHYGQDAILAIAETKFSSLLDAYLTEELALKETDFHSTLVTLQTYLQAHAKPSASISLAAIIDHSTDLHGQAVRQLLIQTAYIPSQIDVVGCHGQTFFHRPSLKLSIVLCHGERLAEQLKISVVTDFRRRDIEAGGQGAPFAPLYHQALARRDRSIPCAVVNCGGIANITVIANGNTQDLIGFDTGPGNGLIDKLIRQRTQGKELMDTNGQYGIRGCLDASVLAALYEKSIIKDGQNYFSLKPPKSLDIGDMCLIPELEQLSIEDAAHTLEVFTADSIVRSLDLLETHYPLPRTWITAGGGWNNPVILSELEQRLKYRLGANVMVKTAAQAGWNGVALEAQIFAYLAVRSLLNLPLSVPGTTNVPSPLTGGVHFHPKQVGCV